MDDENGAESSKMSPQQFWSKFESKFADWKAKHVGGHKQFVNKFNKEYAKSGYKIGRDWKGFSSDKII